MCGNNTLNDKQQEVVLNNLDLAYYIAHKYNRSERLEDIKQAAILGLCEAVLHSSKTDKEFTHYAIVCMRRNIRLVLKLDKELIDSAPLVTLSVQPIVNDLKNLLTKVINELPKSQQDVIKLRFPLELNMKTYDDWQIAGILEKSYSWVCKQRVTALTTLRKKLSGGN